MKPGRPSRAHLPPYLLQPWAAGKSGATLLRDQQNTAFPQRRGRCLGLSGSRPTLRTGRPGRAAEPWQCGRPGRVPLALGGLEEPWPNGVAVSQGPREWLLPPPSAGWGGNWERKPGPQVAEADPGEPQGKQTNGALCGCRRAARGRGRGQAVAPAAPAPGRAARNRDAAPWTGTGATSPLTDRGLFARRAGAVTKEKREAGRRARQGARVPPRPHCCGEGTGSGPSGAPGRAGGPLGAVGAPGAPPPAPEGPGSHRRAWRPGPGGEPVSPEPGGAVTELGGRGRRAGEAVAPGPPPGRAPASGAMSPPPDPEGAASGEPSFLSPLPPPTPPPRSRARRPSSPTPRPSLPGVRPPAPNSRAPRRRLGRSAHHLARGRAPPRTNQPRWEGRSLRSPWQRGSRRASRYRGPAPS